MLSFASAKLNAREKNQVLFEENRLRFQQQQVPSLETKGSKLDNTGDRKSLSCIEDSNSLDGIRQRYPSLTKDRFIQTYSKRVQVMGRRSFRSAGILAMSI